MKVEVREHDGQECAVVTALDGEILAVYRVTRGAVRLRLDESPPGTVEPPAALTRSLALQANSSAMRAHSRALRARSWPCLVTPGPRARPPRPPPSGRMPSGTATSRPRDGRLLPVSALARMTAQLATLTEGLELATLNIRHYPMFPALNRPL